MPQFKALTFGLFVTFIAVGYVSSERNARQAGMPGQPGGMFGGGAGGNGGGSGGGLGGMGGAAGRPGGSGGSGDLSFTLEDFMPMFNAGQLQPTSKPSTRPKIIIGEECANVNEVADFVDSSTSKKKKEWMALILKLSANGHKACATNLSEQLLSL